MQAEPPSWHTVPSQVRCGMRASPLGGMGTSSKEAPGFHFGQFLANLAFCLSSFNCNSHKLQLLDKLVMIIKKGVPMTNL